MTQKNLTLLEKAELRRAKTLKDLLDQIEKIYDLQTGDIHIFNRDLIILGLEKAIALTNSKRYDNK
jgi:hypothetical protein